MVDCCWLLVDGKVQKKHKLINFLNLTLELGT